MLAQDMTLNLVDSETSECTVVRGPPGTGKSQAIANITANAISKGKRVLVVCQKRAALDVVYQRLDKVGLGKYTALIHDHLADRQALYKKLTTVIESHIDLSGYYNTINHLEFISRELDDLQKTQKTIISALSKSYFGGIRIHDLYLNTIRDYRIKLDLSKIIHDIDSNTMSTVLYKIGNLEQGFKTFDVNTHPWYQRNNFIELNLLDNSPLLLALAKLLDSLGDTDVLICPTKERQQELIDSFQILQNEKGFFKKFKPNWIHAVNTIKNNLKSDKFEPDSNEIIRYQEMTIKGKKMWHDIESLSFYLNAEAFNELKKYFIDGDFEKIGERLNLLKTSLDDFEEIYTHDKNKLELSETEKTIFKECSTKLTHEQNWREILKHEIHHHWIEYIENDNPHLKALAFETYQQNRNRIKELLSELKNLTILQIIYKIESEISRPVKMRHSRKDKLSMETSLWYKIPDDLNRKRKQVPVRMLVEKYYPILFRMAPCWLASPEAVSSIFSLKKNMFDLIVFDEASQLAVERALPVMYRGKNIVILGDEKQLRPFNIFDVKNNDEEEIYQDVFDDSMLSESLLVLAKRIYGYRYLNWHYRSKYQELIDFSNYAFYDGNLNVVPNIEKFHKKPPIRWISCPNGKWIDRTNVPEANIVVQEIKEILKQDGIDDRKNSIGVITFNDSQRMAILDEIENLRKVDSEFDELYAEAENLENNSLDDIPFVKNIENVQGDERDIILFSIGYAKDSSGMVRTMFGSLNQEGGENRLNVAITRARREIVIVCSFDPKDLRTEGSKNEGPKRLKEYLLYSKYIGENRNNGDMENILFSVNPNKISETPFVNKNHIVMKGGGTPNEKTIEEIVGEKLKLLGYDIDTRIGNSNYQIDIAVVNPKDPTKYLLAIECDSDSFFSAKSVKERDIIRPQFLESRGWTIERTWSRNWWKDPQRELDRLHKRIQELTISQDVGN